MRFIKLHRLNHAVDIPYLVRLIVNKSNNNHVNFETRCMNCPRSEGENYYLKEHLDGDCLCMCVNSNCQIDGKKTTIHVQYK